MMEAIILLSVIVTIGIARAQSTNVSYSIVAPKAFRPGSFYNLTAACFNAPRDVTLTVRLQRTTDDVTLAETSDVLLANGEAKTLSLQIPDSVPGGDYEVVAVGSGGLTFSGQHPVTLNRKTLMIFVQTDKAVYKPGQTVLFRVITVYPDMKPYKSTMDIAIYDLAGNKIMQWLKQKNDSGVVSQRLPLSEQTPLGDWKITVTAGDNSFTKSFEVAEYVLPKFEVSVALPTFFLVNSKRPDRQEDFQFTVSAKYTYGQMVKGTATITLQLKREHYLPPTDPGKQVMTRELKGGKADVRIRYADLLKLVPSGFYHGGLDGRTVVVSASVEEQVSGIALTGNGTVSCKSEKHTLKFLEASPENFKRGLLYTGFLHLTRANGSPPDPTDITGPSGAYRTVVVVAKLRAPRSEYHHNVYVTKNIDVTATASGYMKFSLTTDSNTSRVSLVASFMEATTDNVLTARKDLSAFKSRDNLSVQVLFDGHHGISKIPGEAKFYVVSNVDIASFQYGVMSRGNILWSETVTGRLSRNHSFTIDVTKDLAVKLAPSARVVVWVYTASGEIVTDSTEVSVSSSFANEVTISFDRETTTPSENVSLTVNAEAGSYIGLLAVDQSVLLLKSGNDITQDTVFNELSEFSETKKSPNGHHRHSFYWPYFILGANSKQILDNSGLFILTDGHVHSNDWGMDDTYGRMRFQEFVMPNGDVNEGNMRIKSLVSASNTVEEDSTVARVNFPETWMWTEAVTSASGSVTLQTSVPDTITSWIASAFAVSDVAGLGVASNTAKMTVFKKFFISPSFPYSIIRGEEFGLKVNVFNYLPETLDVLVSLEDSEYFSVANSSWQIEVGSDDAVSVSFWIVAKTLGQIPINIRAISPIAGDAMRVMLLVKPEGVQQQYSTSLFLQVSPSDPPLGRTLYVSLPPTDRLVPGSENVELTVVGDIMGPSVKGLDNLLKMPYGCGEQNMLNFAPDVYIVKYLSVASELTPPDLMDKALSFMNLGYQRELTFQRTEGSFSAFGNSDAAGSIWLSAFVIKCFHQARDFITIDDAKIAVTMNWMLDNQAKDGSFAEPPNGRVIHQDMQGGSSKGLSMTAYVLIALLENADNKMVDGGKLRRSIELARTYLERQLPAAASDPYALSIIAYAMAQANSSKVNDVLLTLEGLAKIEAGTKHWEKGTNVRVDDDESSRFLWKPPYDQAKAVNIEMTSYALLTYCHRRDLTNSLPIVKWIIAQRNPNGGFSSTQDTVMALEALAEFASMTAGPSKDKNLEVSVTSDQMDGKEHHFLPVTPQTTILLQAYELPSKSTKVEVTAAGSGSVLIQLNVLYNVYKTYDYSGISLKINTVQRDNRISIRSCGSWNRKDGSGMVVMEVNQLTGFKASNLDRLRNGENELIKRVEDKDGKIVIYFDEFTSDETCVNIVSEKIMPVGNIQDASIKVYSYYDPSEARTMFYRAESQKSVCQECPQCCGLPDGSSFVTLNAWIVIGGLLIQALSSIRL